MFVLLVTSDPLCVLMSMDKCFYLFVKFETRDKGTRKRLLVSVRWWKEKGDHRAGFEEQFTGSPQLGSEASSCQREVVEGEGRPQGGILNSSLVHRSLGQATHGINPFF